MKENKDYQSQIEEDVIESTARGSNYLTLHNDDLHTFEYVIESLMEVCEHDVEQAEQCTYLVHYKGKCDVKKGAFNYLMPYKKELSRRGLTATIS